MKKSIIALFAAATMVAGVNAQDNEGGTSGLGSVSGGMIATGVVAAGIVAGVVNNNSADAPGNGREHDAIKGRGEHTSKIQQTLEFLWTC